MDALNEALNETLIFELNQLKQEKIQLQQEYDDMKAQRDDLIDQLHDYESRS